MSIINADFIHTMDTMSRISISLDGLKRVLYRRRFSEQSVEKIRILRFFYVDSLCKKRVLKEKHQFVKTSQFHDTIVTVKLLYEIVEQATVCLLISCLFCRLMKR